MASSSYSRIITTGDQSDTELVNRNPDRVQSWTELSSKSPDPDLPSRISAHSTEPVLGKHKAVSTKDWPTRPESLQKHGFARGALLFCDIVLCCIPLMFIVLAGMADHLDGQPISDWGQRVVNWSLFAPTIFPIAFSAMVGCSMRHIAHYRLERGESVKFLELLMGSQTVFSAVTTQFGLRTLSATGCGVALLWAFSPVGGQVSLQVTAFDAGYSTTLSSYVIDPIYTGCLLGSPAIKNGSQDSWGNIKIPRLETLDRSARDGDGWMPVPKSGVQYSSLLGHPVAGIPTNGSSSFALETYYFDLQCQKLWGVNGTNDQGKRVDWYRPLGLQNFSDCYPECYDTTSIWNSTGETTTFIIDTYTQVSADRDQYGNDTSPQNVFWISRSATNPEDLSNLGVTMANCSIQPSFVESYVECDGNPNQPVCGVSKMRKSSQKQSPPIETATIMGGDDEIWDFFTGRLANAVEPVDTSMARSSIRLHRGVPIDDFTRRLGQVLNTYWLASLAAQASTGSVWNTPVKTVLNSGPDSEFAGNFFDFAANATTASFTTKEEVYACDKAWLSILIISSTLLLIVGVIGIVLKFITLAPNVLGCVSSMTRDNPYTPNFGGSSALDGLERSRIMGDVKVRLEDVNDRGEYGHIALSSASSSRLNSNMRLRKGRLYS